MTARSGHSVCRWKELATTSMDGSESVPECNDIIRTTKKEYVGLILLWRPKKQDRHLRDQYRLRDVVPLISKCLVRPNSSLPRFYSR